MPINPSERERLIERALEMRANAYAPYSQYAVGAALLSESGTIYAGANVENAAYPSSMCAERAAVFAMASAGERHVKAIAVATENGGTPCGACRQVLSEFGSQTLVLVVNGQGEVVYEGRLDELLPHSFGPDDLMRG
jgi:cytidine deaminase